jgi:hypothetical protein
MHLFNDAVQAGAEVGRARASPHAVRDSPTEIPTSSSPQPSTAGQAGQTRPATRRPRRHAASKDHHHIAGASVHTQTAYTNGPHCRARGVSRRARQWPDYWTDAPFQPHPAGERARSPPRRRVTTQSATGPACVHPSHNTVNRGLNILPSRELQRSQIGHIRDAVGRLADFSDRPLLASAYVCEAPIHT